MTARIRPVVKNEHRQYPSPYITPYDMAKAVNAYAGEDRVRWNKEFTCFVTTNGDVYPEGSIEDIANGLLRDKANEHSE